VAVLGEPPSIEVDLAEAKEKLHEAMAKAKEPAKKAAIGAGAVLALGLALYVFFGPADHLERTAKRAADALAAGDASTIKGMAASGTEEEVGRWYEEAHRRLVNARERWYGGKDEAIEVRVGQEDKAQRKGGAGISIHPALAGGLDVSLANPAAATAGADSPFDIETNWVLDRWGHWHLDGHESYAKVQPATPPVAQAQAH
jgi:hypothetical protein